MMAVRSRGLRRSGLLTAFGLGLLLAACAGGVTPMNTALPTTSPTWVPTVTPTPSPGAGTFTSTLYGYSVDRPVGWQIAPATVRWPYGAAYEGKTPEWFDVFIQPDASSPNVGWNGVGAQPIPEGLTAEEWMLAYAERQAASTYVCKGPPEDWVDAVVDTFMIRRIDIICDGLLLSGEDATGWHAAEAVFVVDGIGYVMRGNRDGIEALLRSFQPG